jgi:trans-aconitate methyltransferase
MKIPFKLPPVRIGEVNPEWIGSGFVIGAKKSLVLEYSENTHGWTDDLTILHENAVGDVGGHPIDSASRHDAITQLKNYMPSPSGVVLEVGCSSGYLVNDLLRELPLATIIASDVVKKPLEELALRVPEVPFFRFDLVHCPFPNQSVDAVVMLNVLEHIQEDTKALNKVADILKPQGILIVEVPAYQWLYGAYDQEVRHFRRYNMMQLNDKLRDAGFDVIRKTYLGFLLFPAFALVKLINKFIPHRCKDSLVKNQIRTTAVNPLVKWAMEIESTFLSSVSLPFGIRILVVARKRNR